MFILSFLWVTGLSYSATIFILGSSDPTYVVADNISGFSSSGNELEGSVVNILYADGSQDSAIWAETTAGAGAAAGNNWSFSLTSSSNFSSPWTFTNTSSGVATLANTIASIQINVASADEAFDLSTPSPGTTDSANGNTFNITNTTGLTNFDQTVTFDWPTSNDPDPHVADFWSRMTIEVTNNDNNTFDGIGPGQSFQFIQDTDSLNSSMILPEPSTAMLTSLSLLSLYFNRKRNFLLV